MRKWSILLAVAGLLCCTGCIVTPLKHRPEAAEPIKIGLLLTASSEQAPQYRRLRAGVVFAAEELNRGNGVNGRSVEILCHAAGSNPEKAVQAVADFDRQGVSAVILGGTSSEIRAVLPSLRKYRIPGIAALATADRFSEDPELEKWITRATFSDTQQGIVLGAFLKYYRNLNRVAVLVENSARTAYSRNVAKALRELFEKADGKIVCAETFVPGKSYNEALKHLLLADPEAIFIGATGAEEAARWVNMLRQAGYHGVLAGPDLWEDPAFLKNCPDRPGDCIFTSLYAADLKEDNNRAFRQAFREKYSCYPGDYEAQGYDALKLICRSIAYSGTLEEFTEGLKGLSEFAGASAYYSYLDGEVQRSIFLKTLRPSGREQGAAVSRHRLTLTPGRLELFRDKPVREVEKSIWEEIK